MKHPSSSHETTRTRWLVYPFVAILAAALVFSFLYLLYPVRADTVLTRRLLGATGGRWNTLHHAAPVVPGVEPLARSSPDVLYSLAPVVIAENPILLEVDLSDETSALHYWALSVFTSDLTSIFVTNDQDPPGKHRRKYVFLSPGVARDRADPEAAVIELGEGPAILIMQYVPSSTAGTKSVDEMRRRARMYELWMTL